jgi:hypothetical protein
MSARRSSGCTRSCSRRSACPTTSTATESQREQIELYREKRRQLDDEIEQLVETSRATARPPRCRSSSAGRSPARPTASRSTVTDIVYRDFYAYARDVVLTRQSQGFAPIAAQFDRDEIEAAQERLGLLTRTPANTLSSNVAGLTPAQHIDQIFQVINKKRRSSTPLCGRRSSGAVDLPEGLAAADRRRAGDGEDRGREPVDARRHGDRHGEHVPRRRRPVVAGAELVEPGRSAAVVRPGGGRLRAEDGDGRVDVVTDAAYTYGIGSLLGATPTFAQFLTAVGAGASAVYANSGRQADTLYMAEDRFWYMFGLSSDQFAQFANGRDRRDRPAEDRAGARVRAGEIVVGDSSGLLVAETAGAPVELRAVEPAIGGLEVGIIGAFEAVVVDDGAFSLITTAS